MRVNEISVVIGGEAGAGITRSGFLLGKAFMRGGFHVFGINDYQSLIRGGHNFYIIRAAAEKIYSQTDTIDLLLALNKEIILLHKRELIPGGGILYDEEDLSGEDLGRDDVNLYPVPLRGVVKELEGETIMRNTVALGAAAALVDYDLAILEDVIRDAFKGDVAEINVRAAKMGYDHAKQRYGGTFGYRLEKLSTAGKGRMLLTGNEAVGIGAIRSGCKL
ncbi:MAG: 2-oxoacid:acceptor oxidoreductase family protein [Candidatus Bathyarchaeia archaeon]